MHRPTAGAVILLLALAVLPYANCFSGGFEGDSGLLIPPDTRIQHVTTSNIAQIFTQPYYLSVKYTGLFRPAATLSWMFNYAVLRNHDHAAGYHAVNLALHLANVLLAWLLALRIFKAPLPAFFTAAIFAVHPVNTEAVANLAGRPDLMAAFGVLAALLLHVLAPRARIIATAGIFAAGLIGVFSKENAVVLPALMLLYDVLFRTRRDARALIPNYAAALAAVAALLVARYALFSRLPLPDFPFVDNPLIAAGFLTARLTALEVIWRYLALLAWPQSLSWNYSYNQIPLATTAGGLAALAGLLAVLILLALLIRRNPAACFFGAFFFVSLIPTANLLMLIGSIMAERFLYLPSIGFAACLTAAALAIPRRNSVVIPVLAVIILAFGTRSWYRGIEWTDGMQLWRSGVQAAPGSFKTHMALSYGYRREVARDPANFDRAIAESEKAVAILDPLPAALSNTAPLVDLAGLYRIKGDAAQSDRPAEAATWYRQALAAYSRAVPIDRAGDEARRRRELARGWPPARIALDGDGYLYYGMADTYRRLGRLSDAADSLHSLLKITPLYGKVYLQVADLERAMGHRDAYVRALWQALAVDSQAGADLQLTAAYADSAHKACVLNSRPSRDCPEVQADDCAAHRELIARLIETGHPDAAQGFRIDGCPAE